MKPEGQCCVIAAAKPIASGNDGGHVRHNYCFAFAHESRSATVRLNTGAPALRQLVIDTKITDALKLALLLCFHFKQARLTERSHLLR